MCNVHNNVIKIALRPVASMCLLLGPCALTVAAWLPMVVPASYTLAVLSATRQQCVLPLKHLAVIGSYWTLVCCPQKPFAQPNSQQQDRCQHMVFTCFKALAAVCTQCAAAWLLWSLPTLG
jgi:hypothetical protein